MSKYISCALAFIIAASLAGCENADYKIKKNMVYLTSAASQNKSETIPFYEDRGLDLNIVVRIDKASDKDVTVGIRESADVLTRYNERTGTNYLRVPDEAYDDDENLINATVTIPAGEVSGVLVVPIKKFQKEPGAVYAIPVQLYQVLEGDVSISISESEFVYKMGIPWIVSAPVFRMDGRPTTWHRVYCQPYNVQEERQDTPWGIQLTQYTVEFWARFDQLANQAVVSNSGQGANEIFIRNGDANAPQDYMQIKTLKAQLETPAGVVKVGEWNHWAFVWEGTNIYIYQNGELSNSMVIAAPEDGYITLDQLQLAGSIKIGGAAMCQFRFWKVARTPAEIKNNFRNEVPYKNPNLLIYLPMNTPEVGGSDNFFEDVTGNGHDAYGYSVVLRWDHNINLSE